MDGTFREIIAESEKLGLRLPAGIDLDTRAGRRAYLAAAMTAARAAMNKAAAAEARRDDFDNDDDPLRQAYHVGGGAAFVETPDEDDGVGVADDDSDWEGHDATPELDRFFPKRKADAKSDDAPRGKQEAADGPRQTPLARLLKTSDSSGGPDHESTERRTTPMERFLRKRK